MDESARATSSATDIRVVEEAEHTRPFFKRLLTGFTAHDVPGQAAHVAFFAFLSFPPIILVIFSLTGLFGDESTAIWLTNQLQAGLPGEASGVVNQFVDQVVNEEAPGLFSVGLLLTLWAASNVFAALGRSLNQAYELKDQRNFLVQRLIGLGVMLVFVVLFLSGSVVLIAGPGIASGLGLWGTAEVAWAIIQWPLALLLIVSAFWIAYYVLPARNQSGEKWKILVGAVVGALLWVGATAGFRFYISNFGNYSETYGILGTIIVILMWMWISGIVALLGGEIAAQLHLPKRKAHAEAVSG